MREEDLDEPMPETTAGPYGDIERVWAPESHRAVVDDRPDDPDPFAINGRFVRGPKDWHSTAVYRIEKYVPHEGVWLVDALGNRKPVSERAIGRTFHFTEESF